MTREVYLGRTGHGIEWGGNPRGKALIGKRTPRGMLESKQ